MSEAASLVIAVLTYRREAELTVLLPQLVQQAKSFGALAHVLVVDNDPAGSAEPILAALGSEKCRYIHEERPGISAARNRALDESSEVDLLVFIDDDESPVEHWLRDLVTTMRRSSCAAVVGPVISDYAVEPDPWLVAGAFFARRRLPTGTVVSVAATNNLLLDMTVIGRLGLRFDEGFGISGGSDTLFSRQLTAAGEHIVWCDEALVHDLVPASRLTRRWVLKRALRSGNSWSRTSVQLASGGRARALCRAGLLAQSAPRVVGGGGQVVAGYALRRMTLQARGARTVARGVGMVLGALGRTVDEYSRPTKTGASA